MCKLSFRYIFAVVMLSAWSSFGLASTVLYSNNFNGALSYAINALPSSTTGLIDAQFLPPPNPADCLYIEGLGALSIGCSVNHNPAAGIPGNIAAILPTPFYLTTDSNGVPVFSSTDPVITVEVNMAYVHDVTAKTSKNQAKFYNTDVNDSRLGWGFIAFTSADSPVNVCLGITANKIIAFVDGVSQTSSSDTGPGFNFISLKELADYAPGLPVNIKIRIDKVHRTGTYLINNVPKLVVDLAGAFPANGMTLASKTELAPRGSRPTSLEQWSFGVVPMLSHLDLASLGSAKGRNTDGGLLDAKFTATFFGLNQVFPAVYVQPFNSWVDNYAFGTQYLIIFDSIKIYSDDH